MYTGPCALDIPDLPVLLAHGAAAVLNGVIYFCGGKDSNSITYNHCYTFNGKTTFKHTQKLLPVDLGLAMYICALEAKAYGTSGYRLSFK